MASVLVVSTSKLINWCRVQRGDQFIQVGAGADDADRPHRPVWSAAADASRLSGKECHLAVVGFFRRGLVRAGQIAGEGAEFQFVE